MSSFGMRFKRASWGLIALGVLGSAMGTPARAQEFFAQVTGAQGQVTFADRAVKPGSTLSTEGVLSTGADGSAVVHFRGKATDLYVAPNTRISIVRPDPKSDKFYEVHAGQCRWAVQPAGKPTKWIKVRTWSAIMGVRGTDFLAVYNPLLGESEIVVFEGNVRFASAKDPTDSKEVPAGHWGGIGGRFGKKIGDLIQLTPEILSALKKPVDLSPTVRPTE